MYPFWYDSESLTLSHTCIRLPAPARCFLDVVCRREFLMKRIKGILQSIMTRRPKQNYSRSLALIADGSSKTLQISPDFLMVLSARWSREKALPGLSLFSKHRQDNHISEEFFSLTSSSNFRETDDWA